MRLRRRRIEYSPEQDASRKKLDRAELWVEILSGGISKRLEREYVCGGGMRMLMEFVNGPFAEAVTALEEAQDHHDKLFKRGKYRTGRGQVTVVSGHPRPNPKTERSAAK